MVVLYGCSSKFVVAGEDGSAPGSPEAAAITPPSPEDGAPPGADSGADAARPTTRCTRGAPFGAPELVAELSTAASEAAASLTEDELTLFREKLQPVVGRSLGLLNRNDTFQKASRFGCLNVHPRVEDQLPDHPPLKLRNTTGIASGPMLQEDRGT